MAQAASRADAPPAAQRPAGWRGGDSGEQRAVPAWSDVGCRGVWMEDLTEHEGLLIQQVYENMSTSRVPRAFSSRKEECVDDSFSVPETVLDDSCLLGGHGPLTTASRMPLPVPAEERSAARTAPTETLRRAQSAGSPRRSAINDNRTEVMDAVGPQTDLSGLDRSARRHGEPETFTCSDALNAELAVAPANSEQESVLRLADLIAKATADLAVGCTRSANEYSDFMLSRRQNENRYLPTAAVGNSTPKSPGKRSGFLDRSTANDEFSELAHEKSRTSMLRDVDARKTSLEATLAHFERTLNSVMYNDENLRPLPPICQARSTQSDDTIWGPGSLLWQQYSRSLASLSKNVAAAHEVMSQIQLEMSRLPIDASFSKADTMELRLSPLRIKDPSIGKMYETRSSTLCGNVGRLRDNRDRRQQSRGSTLHLRPFGSSPVPSKVSSPTAVLLDENVVLAVREAVREAVRDQQLPNVPGPRCAVEQKHFRDVSTATESPRQGKNTRSLQSTPIGGQHIRNDRDTPTAPLSAVNLSKDAQRRLKEASDAVSYLRKARNELKLVSENRRRNDHSRTGVAEHGGSARSVVSRNSGLVCGTANAARKTHKKS